MLPVKLLQNHLCEIFCQATRAYERDTQQKKHLR